MPLIAQSVAVVSVMVSVVHTEVSDSSLLLHVNS